MTDVNKLLKKAKRMLGDLMTNLFAGNEDSFIDSLGVDPELYAVNAPDGSRGYDFLKILNDTAMKDWADGVSEFGVEEYDQ